MRFGREWEIAYLPIAHDALLIARHGQDSEPLDPKRLNEASASLSFSTLFASQCDDREERLQRMIGTADAGLSDDEISRVVSETWDRLT